MLWLTTTNAVFAQATEARLPALPTRTDTLTVARAGAVIGRAIVTWVRAGLEQVQVCATTSTIGGARAIDSLFADPRSLRPIRSVRRTGDTTVVVIFGRDTIFVTTTIAGRSETSRALAPAAGLYASASIEALAATLPLRHGASLHVLAFYSPPSPLSVRRTTIRVEERETVRNRTRWRVVADTPGGGSTFWVDAATRRVLESEVRDGITIITLRR